jgi:hypothetical protein
LHVALRIDGTEVASGTVPVSAPLLFSANDCLDVGRAYGGAVSRAYAEYAAQHPGWTAGARTGTIVHPGTATTLANLLSDVSAAHVADGVTLRGPDASALIRVLLDDVAPLLAGRGIALRDPAAA